MGLSRPAWRFGSSSTSYSLSLLPDWDVSLGTMGQEAGRGNRWFDLDLEAREESTGKVRMSGVVERRLIEFGCKIRRGQIEPGRPQGYGVIEGTGNWNEETGSLRQAKAKDTAPEVILPGSTARRRMSNRRGGINHRQFQFPYPLHPQKPDSPQHPK